MPLPFLKLLGAANADNKNGKEGNCLWVLDRLSSGCLGGEAGEPGGGGRGPRWPVADSLRMSLVGRREDPCLGENWDPLEIQAPEWRARMSWGTQGPRTQELQTPPSPSSALAHHTGPTLAPPSSPNTRNARLLPTLVLLIGVRSWGLSWWHLAGRPPTPFPRPYD